MRWGVRKAEKYRKKADSLRSSARKIRNSKTGDYDDEEYFEMQSPEEKAAARKRAQAEANRMEKEADRLEKEASRYENGNRNPNYSQEQRNRDRRVYSKGAERRINSAMNKGSGIQEARSYEANRIASARRRSVIGGQIGSVIGGVGGAVAGYKVSNYLMDKYGSQIPNDPTVQMTIKLAISAGVANATTQIGRYGGRSVGMISGGYSPSKFRY